MDELRNVTTRVRLWDIARLGFLILIAVTLISGYLGMHQYLAGPAGAGFGRSSLDLIYYVLQLFVLGSAPLGTGGPYPWTLELARFAAPAATVYALFEAGHALLADQFRRLRMQSTRGHTVVTGTTTAAQALAEELRRTGTRVIAAPSGDPDALRAAGAIRATALYACEDGTRDTATNVATALTAARLRRTTPLKVYAQVSDADLALALQARRLALPEPDLLHLDFFNLEELAARELMRTEDLDVPEGTPHLTVTGHGAFARTIIAEYARQWRLRGPRPTERVAVTIVDQDAATVASTLAASHSIVADVCDLTPITAPLEEHLRAHTGAQPHRAYLCDEDEQLALRTALTLPGLWRGGPGSLVVRLNRLAHHRSAFHHPDLTLLDDIGGRLRLIGVTQLACVPVAIEESLVERLAQAIHEHYLLEQVHAGVPIGANNSMRPWHSANPHEQALSEDRKDANRAQARHIGAKLSRIGCGVASRTSANSTFEFQDHEVEQLAEAEHQRWMLERQAAGWRYHPVRDDATKRHNCLVPWTDLPENERDKDRQAIHALPTVLATVGLQITRL